MKEILEKLKHMWKDPINTIEEADARKKEIMPWFYGSIGVAVIPSILGNLISALSFLSMFSIIGAVGIIAFGFMLFIIKKAKEKFAALTCDKCNTMAKFATPEEYAKCVSYSVDEYLATYDGISHPASNNGVVAKITAKASASAVAIIDLKCPHCGNVKQLKYAVVPFRCVAKEEKVLVRDVESVKTRLENSVKEVVKDFNDPEKRTDIPYSIHSKKNPNYENRGNAQLGTKHIPLYNGARIEYHKDVEEMVDAFFLENQLDGVIVDASKPKK